MLEAMRQHSRSMIIYVIFGILIAVFVLTFGPQSGGCVTAVPRVGKIDGRTLTDTDFQFGYNGVTLGREISQEQAKAFRLRERIMDLLIDRELYAQSAERLGLRVGDDEVDRAIQRGHLLILGEPAPQGVVELAYKDGAFDYQLFKKRLVASVFNMTVKQFEDEERRELLAEKMRDLLRAGVVASPDEVKADYVNSHTQVTLAYAQFSSRSYEAEVQLPTADVDAYVAAHQKELQAEYDAKKAALYTGLPKQVHVQQIFVGAPKGDTARVAAGRAKADAALKRIAGGEDFGAVARAVSEDGPTRTKGAGGDAGWRRLTDSGADPAIEGAIGKLKQGEVSPVVETDAGFYILKAVGFREGDLKFQDVERELAENDLRSERGKAMARDAAKSALARLRPGATLETLFPPASPAGTTPSSAPASQPAGVDKSLPTLVVGEPFSRQGTTIPGVGDDAKLAHQVFDEMKAGEVAKQPFEHDDATGGTSWFVYEVKARVDPSMDDFVRHQATYTSSFEQAQFEGAKQSWAERRCTAMRDAGKITVNPSYVTYEGSDTPDTPYVPCKANEQYGL